MTKDERNRNRVDDAVNRARELRHQATYPERKLWQILRARQIAAMKFRRQYPLGPYIADFYCAKAKLIVEVDGDSHAGQAAADRARQQWLEAQGVTVVRVSNDDVLHDEEAVVRMILLAAGP